MATRVVLWTAGQNGLPAQTEHDCQLLADIRMHTYNRRYLAGIPPFSCFASHLASGDVMPVLAYAYSRQEYINYYADNLSHVTTSPLRSYSMDEFLDWLGDNGYNRPWRVSRASDTVFLQRSPTAADAGHILEVAYRLLQDVPNGTFCYRTRFNGSSGGFGETPVTGVWRDVIFYQCVFDRMILRDCHFENCFFIGCGLDGTHLHNVTLAGGLLQGHGNEANFRNVLSTGGLALNLARSTLVKVQTTDTIILSNIRDSVVRQSSIPGVLLRCSDKEIKLHKCIQCGQQKPDCIKIHAKAWLCLVCKERKFSHRYANDTFKGRDGTLPAFSFEAETASRDDAERQRTFELLAYGFISTADSTVDIEYKSPIFLSLDVARPSLAAMDRISDTIRANCGTHLHVFCPVKDVVGTEVFLPLVNHCRDNRTETTFFWGRYFNDYCRDDVGNNRYDAFSKYSSQQTIEWRLPRFRTAEQYTRVIQFCRDATKLISDAYTGKPHQRVDAATVGQQVLKLYQDYVTRSPLPGLPF